MRIDSILDLLNLLHQFLVNGLTAGGIDDDDVVAVGLGFLYGIESNLDGVCGTEFDVNGYANLFGEHP